MANTAKKQMLVENTAPVVRAYREDAFTLQDGHYVGHDGFVVPKDFNEFYSRFPRYVSTWVKRRLFGSALEDEAEDLTQELLMHLQFLPTVSKHRLDGKQDVIQTFDPHRIYGANEARFRFYVNLCLANRCNTISGQRKKNPLFHPRNLSFGNSDNDDPVVNSDDYCHKNSRHLRAEVGRNLRTRDDDLRLREFVGYLSRHHPRLVAFVEGFRATASWSDTARLLGTTPAQCSDARQQLRQAAKDFTSRSLLVE